MKQKNKLLCRVERTIDENDMLCGQRGVLVGYSGGADSSALLYVMSDICRRRGIYLAALHVNHGIRGDEATRDEELCRAQCERMGIDFTAVRFDIPTIAKDEKCGLEETARKYRYDAFFHKLASDERLTCIATAHNADDNAETVIFNLARGSGIDGLCGIPHVRAERGVKIIRPLLDTVKSDILAYCEENRVQYIFDSTNSDTAYRRNYIRHEIIPRLTQLNPEFLRSVSRACENLTCDGDYICAEAESFVTEHASDGSIDAWLLTNAHDAIASRTVSMLYSRISSATLERVHIFDVLALAKKGINGSRISLPDGVFAVIKGGRLYFTREKAEAPVEFCRELHYGKNDFPDLGFGIFMAKTDDNDEGLQKDNETLQNIYKLAISATVNSDTIKHMLYARSRRDGDAYVFGGMTRKLKKLYNDRSLDESERRRLPIIADDKGIILVPGFKVADRAKPFGDAVKIIYYYGDINE